MLFVRVTWVSHIKLSFNNTGKPRCGGTLLYVTTVTSHMSL